MRTGHTSLNCHGASTRSIRISPPKKVGKLLLVPPLVSPPPRCSSVLSRVSGEKRLTGMQEKKKGKRRGWMESDVSKRALVHCLPPPGELFAIFSFLCSLHGTLFFYSLEFTFSSARKSRNWKCRRWFWGTACDSVIKWKIAPNIRYSVW